MNEKEALLNQLRDVELPEVSAVPALPAPENQILATTGSRTITGYS